MSLSFTMDSLGLYDALVIGAGPIGSKAACRLAGLGYKVAVFEEHEEIGQPMCCTGLISRECVERFHIPEELILRPANSAKLFAPYGNSFRIWKEETQACVVDRAAFDVAWAQRAQEKGAEYHLGSRVKDIELLSDCVRADVEQQGIRTYSRGKVALITTGFASNLPQRVGLGQVGDYIAGAQTEVDIKDDGDVEIYFGRKIAPGFFAWLVPFSSHRALAGLFSRRKPGLYLRNLLNLLSQQGKIATSGAKFSYSGVPLRSLSKTYGERLMVVGDAAGQVKPTTGGGIYYGLLCADIAAEVAHSALCGNDFSERVFSQYQRAWKAILGKELRMGRLIRRLYERLSDEQIEKIFHIAKANGIHEDLLQSPQLSFDWHAKLILKGLRYLKLWRHIPSLLLNV
jgi:geranylgeranyl reductase family protein